MQRARLEKGSEGVPQDYGGAPGVCVRCRFFYRCQDFCSVLLTFIKTARIFGTHGCSNRYTRVQEVESSVVIEWI